MRVAFFGGSFDPPHRGHLAVAETALHRLALDRVLMAPVGVQPLKRAEAHTAFADRLAMVRLACRQDARLEPSALDAPRPDGRPNYSYETLEALRRELSPEDALFFLVGADAVATLKQWHRAAELLCVCELIVAGRPGVSVGQICQFLPAGVECTEETSGAELSAYLLRGGCTEGRRLYAMPDLQYDVSATALRAALAVPSGAPKGYGGGREAAGLLDPAVAEYARARGLYVKV